MPRKMKQLHWTQRPGGPERLSGAVKAGWAKKRAAKALREMNTSIPSPQEAVSEASQSQSREQEPKPVELQRRVITPAAEVVAATDEMVMQVLLKLQERRACALAALQVERLKDGTVRNMSNPTASLLFPPTGKDMGLLMEFVLQAAQRERSASLAVFTAHVEALLLPLRKVITEWGSEPFATNGLYAKALQKRLDTILEDVRYDLMTYRGDVSWPDVE